ncbi:MAG TPA: P1 family peptidase, partial [Actinomycetota bacterium]|nr:P1 family peptidase [Actinomycetota bacterium]
VGAGTGATVGKWAGVSHARPAGIGTASLSDGELVVGALVACNAVGDVYDERGEPLAATGAGPGATWEAPSGRSTVLTVVATNARFDRSALGHVAAMSDAGVVRAVRPAHTPFDGDVVFAAATGRLEAPAWVVGEMGAAAVAEAIRRSVARVGPS